MSKSILCTINFFSFKYQDHNKGSYDHCSEYHWLLIIRPKLNVFVPCQFYCLSRTFCNIIWQDSTSSRGIQRSSCDLRLITQQMITEENHFMVAVFKFDLFFCPRFLFCRLVIRLWRKTFRWHNHSGRCARQKEIRIRSKVQWNLPHHSIL